MGADGLVLSLGAAGLALLLGIGDGPHDALHAGLPVLVVGGRSPSRLPWCRCHDGLPAAVLVYHAIAFWIPAFGGAIAYLPLRHRLLASTPSREIEIDGKSGGGR